MKLESLRTSFSAFFLLTVAACQPPEPGEVELTTNTSGLLPLYSLLQNPDGSSGDMWGWTLLENGGNGWAVSSSPYFVTSFGWGRRTQTVDLYERGFDEKTLADAPPIEISEEFGWTYCPDMYYLKVELLDENLRVVSAFDTGVVQQQGPCDYNLNWQTVSHTFVGYEPGVRYVRWEDGGKDSEFWLGHYGAVMRNAVLKIRSSQ
jgi:hypothetical protein